MDKKPIGNLTLEQLSEIKKELTKQIEDFLNELPYDVEVNIINEHWRDGNRLVRVYFKGVNDYLSYTTLDSEPSSNQ